MGILVTRSSMPPFEEYCTEIRELWDSHWLTNNGGKHRELEARLAEKLGAKHVLLFTNGHLALEALLRVMQLKGEVITTPFTFASTTHAITRCGLTPVFCDIRMDDYTLDPDKLEVLITKRTCAILPVHVYGNLCDVDAIGDIARRHGLHLLYDAAHAFAVEKGSKGAAGFGEAAMFSFHATKVFNTIEGGAIACEDDELAERLQRERNYGITGPDDIVDVGGNAKMSEFQAAMGLCNLRHLDEEIAKRQQVCQRYRERLSGVEGIRLCPQPEDVKPNYSYFPIVLDGYRKTRDGLFDELTSEDIHARKYFYPLTNAFACYCGKTGFDPAATPVARRVAERVMTLPLYADLPLTDVDRICDVILR